MSGWIKLHRKFDKWGWRDNPEMVSLFLHLLTQANFEPLKWHGIDIQRGQVIFGRLEWAERLGISERSLRTCIDRLKSTNEILIESTNRFSIITIVNYEEYQEEELKTTNTLNIKPTSNRPATDQQPTTPKERKNIRKKEKKVSMPPTPQFDFLPDEPISQKKKLSLTEITIEMIEPWVRSHLKGNIDVGRELLKCQNYDWQRPIRDAMATARTWMIKAEKDYLTPTGKVDKHGNFEKQDYRAGIEGFKTTL